MNGKNLLERIYGMEAGLRIRSAFDKSNSVKNAGIELYTLKESIQNYEKYFSEFSSISRDVDSIKVSLNKITNEKINYETSKNILEEIGMDMGKFPQKLNYLEKQN